MPSARNGRTRLSEGAQKCAKQAVARALEQLPNSTLSGAPSKFTAMIYEILVVSEEHSHLLDHLGETREERLAALSWAVSDLTRRNITDFKVPPRTTRRSSGGKKYTVRK